jgi:FlaA1/EpsC-like NDP-sugar epimerase
MATVSLIDRFYRFVKTKSTVPRWIIFILDLCLCDVALYLAYLLRFNMDFDAVANYGVMLPILFVTGLNIGFFGIFRTYEGIIRLSGIQEGVRCVSAVFSSAFVLLASIASSAIFKLPYLVPISVLIIYFFTASFLIFSYRMWVKILYKKSLNRRVVSDDVLIFGKTINRVFLKMQ